MIKNFKIVKTFISNNRLRDITIVSILTYITMSLGLQGPSDYVTDILKLLGGIHIDQEPLSVYALIWLIPKLILYYMLFIRMSDSIQKRLPLLIFRTGTKAKWYFCYNVSTLITIVVWYLIGYLTSIIVVSVKYKTVFSISSLYFKMFMLDILATYCIFNIFYTFTITLYKSLPGIIASLIINFSSMFTNKPERLIFRILPSNHQMMVRQQFLCHSYLYLIVLSIIIMCIGYYLFKIKDISYEGV